MDEPLSAQCEKLYHYTTQRGLFGILDSNQLWATHHKFLNDSSEIEFLKPKLLEYILTVVRKADKELFYNFSKDEKALVDAGGIESIFQKEAAMMCDILYRIAPDEFYITSFCGLNEDDYINKNGLLSQWRGYGLDGGYALIFSTLELEQMLEKEQSNFRSSYYIIADIVYSNDESKFTRELYPRIEEIGDHIYRIYSHMHKRSDDPPDSGESLPAFLECVARYKHRGFSEENEVRIVVASLDRLGGEPAGRESDLGAAKERKFRDDHGRLIPYLELFTPLGPALPIQEIIVGPHKDKEARAAALRVKLRNTDIKISTSEIPYVC